MHTTYHHVNACASLAKKKPRVQLLAMTSLARQLQKLAIPGQPPLKQATSKKCPSLLFEPEKASDISIDTVYSLGLNGLAELINIDQNFVEYEATLFEESGKEFERTVRTEEELKHVDGQVKAFLRCLSPYFLQRATQKCLEWLIRVYQVHVYHVDALMECVLPYYQTNLFARVVQLLPLKDHTSKWYWLQPVKKTGSPISKVTFVQHCLSNLAFLDFVCKCVPHSLKAHRGSTVKGFRMAISLYTSTVMGVLEQANPVREEIVQGLVPYLKKGLKSRQLDYNASTYMVLSQLALVVKMGDSLLGAILDAVSKVRRLCLLGQGNYQNRLVVLTQVP
jgi:U3 small nucleolar RNA-associated protein 10